MRDLLRRGLRLVGARAPEIEDTSETRRSKPLWVITLSISPTPLPLDPPTGLPEVGPLTVFRAKRAQGSKELHLQQLGWFESRPAAEALLPALEKHFPAAMVEIAQSSGMGSLDDTMRAEFKVLRASDVGAESESPGPFPAPVAAAAGAQAYAVQLVRQKTPVDLAKIPRLSVFQGYTLYRVHAERDGIRTYGLRLGFFPDPTSARLVADYVRADFPGAAPVPVSEREQGRVARAGWTPPKA